MARKNKSEITCALYEGHGLRILEREIATSNGDFLTYDIEISGCVIIKDCRVVSGKNGEFLSTPAKEVGGKYYPQAYISPKIAGQILDAINDGDFVDTDLKYLSFATDNDEQEQTTSNHRNRRR